LSSYVGCVNFTKGMTMTQGNESIAARQVAYTLIALTGGKLWEPSPGIRREAVEKIFRRTVWPQGKGADTGGIKQQPTPQDKVFLWT